MLYTFCLIKGLTDLNTFKRKLKTVLFEHLFTAQRWFSRHWSKAFDIVSCMLPIILQYICAGGTLSVFTQILFSSFLSHLCSGRSCSAVNSAPVDDVTNITWLGGRRQPEMASFTTSLMPLTMLSLLASNCAGIQLSVWCKYLPTLCYWHYMSDHFCVFSFVCQKWWIKMNIYTLWVKKVAP